MPLKHRTETRLVILLGLAITITGFVVAALPDLPPGFIPWLGAFFLAVLYPVLLYPMFRRDRADNTFRSLHWVPAIMLMLWLVFKLLSSFAPFLSVFDSWYTWGWAFVAVALAFLALVNFCLDVVRQRIPRVPVLLFVWVIFAFMALRTGAADNTQRWLASVFGGSTLLADVTDTLVDGSGAVMGEGSSDAADSSADRSRPTDQIADAQQGVSSSEPYLLPSSDPTESAWREALRQAEMYRQEKSQQALMDAAASESGSVVATTDTSDSADSDYGMGKGPSSPTISDVTTSPSALPSSGFGWSAVALSLLGLYCASMHRRSLQYVS